MIYLLIILFSLTIAVASTDKRTGKVYNLYFSICSVILLSVFAGIRTIGLDYKVYEQHFADTADILEFYWDDQSIELGYTLILSLFKMFSESFHLFLVVFSLLTLVLAIAFFKRYSPYILLSFFMFFAYSFFPQVMGQMRQPIAIFIALLIAVPLLLKGRKIQAAIYLMITAFFFHKSIFIFVPFVFVGDMILSKKQIFLYLGIALTLYLLSGVMIKVLLMAIPSGMFLFDTLRVYLTEKAMAVNFSMGMIERLGMVGVLFYMSYKYDLYKSDSVLRLFINMYFTGVCLYFSFIATSAELASRGTQTYTYGLFLALPILVKQVRLKDKYLLLSIICAWGIYLSLGIFSDDSEYIPYKSIFF